MKNTLTKGFLLFMLFASGVSVAGGAWAQPVIEGRVLEQGSDAPLANVVVTVVWAGSTGGDGSCLHSAAALTDANGFYRIPEWRHRARMGNFPRVVPVVTAYLAGYVEAGKVEQTFYLARDPADKSDRLQTLDRWRGIAACADAPADNHRPSPLPSALLEEAKTLVDANTEPEKLEPFRLAVESQRYGKVEAKRRQEKRMEKAK